MDVTRLILFNRAMNRIAVLIRAYSDTHPRFPGQHIAVLPGGKRDGGESVLDCVKRETQEEIGAIIHLAYPVKILPLERSRMHFFITTVNHISGDPKIMEPEKFMGGVYWVPPVQFSAWCDQRDVIPGNGIAQVIRELNSAYDTTYDWFQPISRIFRT